MRVPPELEVALRKTGLPWETYIGTKHIKVKLAGRLVAILPKGRAHEADRRALLNTISQVRRAETKIRGEQ